MASTPPQQKAAQLIAGKMGKKPSNEKDLAAEKERLEGLTIDKLSAMEKTLLDGALEKDTVEEGVLQVYQNMHHKTGWTYNAGESGVSGPAYTRGGKTVGMCQGYRNAFADALYSYDALRKKTGSEAVKNGKLDIQLGNDLSDQYFCTTEGLTLMGGLKGNVYCKVDANNGALLEDGIDTINRFVFSGHWTLSANGVFYDPIFESITATGKENVEWKLGKTGANKYLADDGKSRFVPNQARKSTKGEFFTNFIWVTDWPVFAVTLNGMEHLYTEHKEDIDEMLAGKRTSSWSADQKEWHDLAQKIVQEYVSEQDTFLMVATAAIETNLLTNAQFAGVTNILHLAAK